VLAERQNLSKKNASYVAWLNDLSDRDRIKRLYLRGSVDIQPWDDGSLRLAIEALRFKASQTAVCNAVLWSQRGENDKNDNPDQDLQQHSSKLWSKLLPVLNPTLVTMTVRGCFYGSYSRFQLRMSRRRERLKTSQKSWIMKEGNNTGAVFNF